MEEIRQRINQIIRGSTGEGALEKVLAKINAVIETMVTVNAMLKELSRSGSETDYKKAQNEIEKAQNFFEEYQAEKTTNAKGPLITEAEYQAMTAEIKTELAAICKKDKLEIIDLCEQIQTIAARNEAAINEGNDLLQTLQSKVYRYADCPKDVQGRPIKEGHENRFTDENSIAEWVEYGINTSAAYEAMEKSAETL